MHNDPDKLWFAVREEIVRRWPISEHLPRQLFLHTLFCWMGRRWWGRAALRLLGATTGLLLVAATWAWVPVLMYAYGRLVLAVDATALAGLALGAVNLSILFTFCALGAVLGGFTRWYASHGVEYLHNVFVRVYAAASLVEQWALRRRASVDD